MRDQSVSRSRMVCTRYRATVCWAMLSHLRIICPRFRLFLLPPSQAKGGTPMCLDDCCTPVYLSTGLKITCPTRRRYAPVFLYCGAIRTEKSSGFSLRTTFEDAVRYTDRPASWYWFGFGVTPMCVPGDAPVSRNPSLPTGLALASSESPLLS